MIPLAIGLGLAAAGGLINAGRSAYFQRQAKRQLSNLKRNPISPYSVSPQLQAYYSQALDESRTPMGFTGAERATFGQNMAKQTNTLYNNAVAQSGGNLARSLRGALNAASLNQWNQFAAQDAGIARMNRQSALGRVGMGTQTFQRIKNMNEQANIDAQRELGGAIRTQRENIGRAIGSVGNLGLMGAGYGLGMGQGFGGFNGFSRRNRDFNNPNYTTPQNIFDPIPDYNTNYYG